jgi:hypothetical protein
MTRRTNDPEAPRGKGGLAMEIDAELRCAGCFPSLCALFNIESSFILSHWQEIELVFGLRISMIMSCHFHDEFIDQITLEIDVRFDSIRTSLESWFCRLRTWFDPGFDSDCISHHNSAWT